MFKKTKPILISTVFVQSIHAKVLIKRECVSNFEITRFMTCCFVSD